MTEHTKTPWNIENQTVIVKEGPETNDDGIPLTTVLATIVDGRDNALSNSENKANAAFIVRACNAHEDLITILDKLCRNIKAMEVYSEGQFSLMDDDYYVAVATIADDRRIA